MQPEVIRLRRQLEPNLEVWKRTGLDIDLLQPRTTTLSAAEAIVRGRPGAFSPDLEAYVEQSVQCAQARAQAEKLAARREALLARRRAYVFMTFAVLVGCVAVLAVFLYGRASAT